jgi:glutamine amidotransferase PdxT
MLLKNRVGISPNQTSAPALLSALFIFLSLFALSFIGKNFRGFPATGVVTELHCDEGTGTTTADASGNGHTGTLVNGPTWGPGKYGQGINFNGTNSYVNIADHTDYTLTPTQNYTWSAWVKNNNFNQWSCVWSQTLNASNFFYFYAHTSTDAEAGPVTNGVSVYWYSGTSKLVIHSNNNVLTAGQWSYITVTYDASQTQANRFTIYINGVDVTNRTDVVSAGTIAAIDPTNIRIGSDQPYGEYLNGSVDEVRYYRRLLSVAEVQSDMNIVTTLDATPPAVAITAPAAGNVSGTLNVTATASDNIGVAGVQFLLDGVNLGAEDVAAPYSVSWNTTTATSGNHNLTARARDAAGNTTTSSVVTVNVNNADVAAPSVNVTAPATGNVSGTINVTANASDNIGVAGVQFLLDGNNLGTEDITSPYSISWNTTTATNGNHNLTARARDASGNSTTSSIVAVNVNNDTQPPTVTVDPPTASPVSGTINVTATASDNVGVAGVQFLLDGTNLGAEDVAAPFSVSWTTTTASNGVHTITAKARDAAGNITTSASVSFTVFNNSLVAAWGFNENTGTIANDNSGNGNTGTLTNGPTWSSSGKFGAAILFNGSSSLVNVNDANSLDLTNGMTIEAWINPSNLTGYKTIICKENGTNNLAYALSANNSTSGTSNQRPDSRIRIGSNTRTVTGTTKLPLNTWTHIASTYDGTTMRFYVNGVQVSTFATTGSITATTNPFRIGGSTALGSQYFTGLIDEVRIYNRALSAGEIQTDMNTPIAPDVTSPTVGITAPAAGNISGTINITANASDNIAVSGVQFLLNGANMGSEDITSPYSVSWNTLTATNGTYTLTARARDAAGNTAVSSDIIVTVNNDTQLPTVNLTAPAAGTVAGTINISADANDNVGVAGVQFLLNGTNLGAEVITAPYNLQWNTNTVIDGSYTLTARTRDAAGNTQTSSPVIVTILNHPPDTEFPTVSITAPAAGDVLGSINVTANANDNVGVVGVQFLLDGTNLGAEDLTAPYSVSWNTTTIANGTYTLTAKARDAAGNSATSTDVIINVNNPPDTILPTVAVTSPVAGNVAGTITVAANASDNIGVAGVQFLLDGNNLGAENLLSPYTISWNTTTVGNGPHTLAARARDAAGNIGISADLIITVNNDLIAPTINITAPTGGNVSGTINVDAAANDNVGVAGVQFLLDGNNLGAEDTISPYLVSWNTTTITNGSHNLVARARDAAGNISNSNPITVVVNNAVSLITALNFNEGTGTVAADISGKNHNGTLIGASWVAGKYGQAVSFNGTSNYVNIADHTDFTLNPAQNYTWSAWVKNNDFHEWSCVWSQTLSNSNFFYFYAHTSTDAESGPVTNGVSVHWYNGSNKLAIHSTNNVLTAGQWSYITVTYNASLAQASRFTIYVNGADVTNRSDVVSAGTITALDPNNIRVGSDQPFPEYLNGSVDDVRYYNRLLSPAEILTDMNTPIGNDNTAPSVNISAPANGSSVTGTINITANASDNIAVAGVQFLLNGATLGAEDITSPYSVSWNTLTATNGTYTLTARARDAAGNMTTSSGMIVTVNNDTQLPTVNLTGPVAGTVAGTINISADAADNTGVAGVQFLLNSINLGAEILTAPYTISWNTTTVADGTYTLTARARDAAGNTQTSSPVIVNVLNTVPDTEPPTVTVTSPYTGDVSGTINVTANANDNIVVAGVQFLLDGINLGAEDLIAPYTVSWNTYTVSNGDHTLTAIARDAAGNTATSSVVTVTVNNVPDTELPTVIITAPAAGNVSGTINVTANANDNVGVVGVQFLLDGNNLGSEDISSPYSVSWNTITAGAGNHVLTARARDAAGNIAISSDVNITVVISNPPVISNISVNSITAGSAIINWATDVPATSQLNYGSSTAYGLYTLTDSTLVLSHSQILDGLVPGTQYHYQILSNNGTPATSADNTFTTANLAATLGTLNGHTVMAYPTGKIIPWTPNPADGYITVVASAWNYLLNSVPNDPSTGKAAYYSRSYMDPNTQLVVDWPHNPAGLYSMLTESAIKYYNYSANSNVMQLAENVALWHLDHGMTTAADSWASVPYSEGVSGSLTYGGAPQDGVGNLEPDKIGELGKAWLQLYKYDGNIRFRDAAIQAANVLSNKIRVGTISQSPWAFRVNAHDGSVVENYCADVVGPIALLDGLIAAGLGDTAKYRATRTAAWNWMMTYPMQNNVWTQYFEDVGIQSNYNSNLNQYNAMMTARYLLEHPEFDPNWETHVRGLITWVESIFSQTSFGAATIKEQVPVFPYPMGSHTSRYASVNALLYEKTGDLVAKEKAYRSFNWASYMARSNGIDIDGPDVNNQWFTDGYGDYIRHFMTGLAAVPEWTPANQTHLLRSSSVVKIISYSTNSVNYTTYDGNATEVLHINFNPVIVTADGVPLPQRSDLNQPGWTLDVATKTMKIYHSAGTQISISAGTTPPAGRMNATDTLYTYNGKPPEYIRAGDARQTYNMRTGSDNVYGFYQNGKNKRRFSIWDNQH